ncbi:hypothetical protein [Amycolatopsis azurea]|uniref:DUF600 family protein n=1 Tax=Amycolatopsis azurea DSM 43854 TaxID=1238180 RepID=M2PP39_9PSEU|nr:hypothetical protein [Amycolatopsis azurea]EMD26308.1 hypothetical protein C791_3610 [Amycolatopsis azurea DSM 43854]OOC07752.1 hypothetical protein B0293_06375 [Amycolatopsis azurea DSM 43854]
MTDELTTGIASALAEAAPDGWAKISLAVSATVLAYDYATEVRLADGRSGDIDLPAEVRGGFRELRTRMYEADRGTWFSATLVLEDGAPPRFSFAFDEDPKWWPPLHPAAFTRDLEAFPRDEAHIPPWLRDLLGQGAELEREQENRS